MKEITKVQMQDIAWQQLKNYLDLSEAPESFYISMKATVYCRISDAWDFGRLELDDEIRKMRESKQ